MFGFQPVAHKSPFPHLLFILAFCLLTAHLWISEGSHPFRNEELNLAATGV